MDDLPVILIRFALYAKGNLTALAVTLAAFAIFGLVAVWGYDPARGLTARKA